MQKTVRGVQEVKNTFVQIDEKRAKNREKFVRIGLRMSDDTPGMVCIELLNDTPGYVAMIQGQSKGDEGRKNLCTA